MVVVAFVLPLVVERGDDGAAGGAGQQGDDDERDDAAAAPAAATLRLLRDGVGSRAGRSNYGVELTDAQAEQYRRGFFAATRR